MLVPMSDRQKEKNNYECEGGVAIVDCKSGVERVCVNANLVVVIMKGYRCMVSNVKRRKSCDC